MSAEDTTQATFFLISLFIYFIFGCSGSLLLHKSFLQLWPVGALCCSVLASHCSGLSQSPGSRARELSSCGTQAWLSLQESSWIRDPVGVPCIVRQILNHATIRKVLGNYSVTSLLSMLLLLESVFFCCFFKIYLVSSFWLCWLLIAVCGLSVVAEKGSLPWLWFLGFSLQWILLLRGMGAQSTMASVFAAHGLGSCGPWAQLSLSMWVLPGPGIVLMSPALVGGFFTTEPLGKPKSVILKQTLFLNDFQFLKNYSNSVKKENYLWTKIYICQKQKIAQLAVPPWFYQCTF